LKYIAFTLAETMKTSRTNVTINIIKLSLLGSIVSPELHP